MNFDLLEDKGVCCQLPFHFDSGEYQSLIGILKDIKFNLKTKNHRYRLQDSNLFFERITDFFETNFSFSVANRVRSFYKITDLEPFEEVGVHFIYEKGDITPDIIKINLDGIRSSKHFVTASHEYIHALLCQNYSVVGNFYYNELLSILVEKLAAVYLEKKKLDNKLLYRINCERVSDFKDVNMKSVSQDLVYLISDIYATNLFEKYKNIPNLLKDVNTVLEGKDSIPNLLNDYNISLKNEESIKIYQKVLRQHC